MAADQERADRIRALKQERPDLTWRRIADHVGVTERAASDWQKKGGIEYDNAKKLAALFEVDVDYIWRGTETDTPSPFAGPDDLASLIELIRQDIADRQRQRNEIIARLNALERAILDGTREINDETAARLLRLGQAVVQGQPLEEDEPDPQLDRGRRRGDAKKPGAKSRIPARP